MNDLESETTQGYATYFEDPSYSPGDCKFSCELFHNPESPKNFRILSIPDIESFDAEIIDEDPDCIETIMGADREELGNGRFKVNLFTDKREVLILSSGIIDMKIQTRPSTVPLTRREFNPPYPFQPQPAVEAPPPGQGSCVLWRE